MREGIGLTGSWGADGQIIFASVSGEAIFRVSTSGGTPVAEQQPDPSKGETRFVWPAFLPDGRRYLFTAAGRDQSEIRLAEPGRPSRTVLNARSPAQYVNPGYLLYVEDSALLARRFETSSGTVTGDSIPVADEVGYFPRDRPARCLRRPPAVCWPTRTAPIWHAWRGSTAPGAKRASFARRANT